MDWSWCCLLRFECIAQKQMAPCAFDAHKGSPEGVLRCETLTSDEPWPLSGGVSTGDLWGKCQEQFIQQTLCKKVPQQLWATSTRMRLHWRTAQTACTIARALSEPAHCTPAICTAAGTLCA